MSSKKGHSRPKKKDRPHHRRHRRSKNLWKKDHPRVKGSFFKKRPRRRRFYSSLAVTYAPSVTYLDTSHYKRRQPPLNEEASIKMYFVSLKKDIEFYKELKGEYTRGGLVDNVANQINRDCSEIEENLKESNLPKEKLEEFEKEYEIYKSKLKEIGFYED